MAILSKQQRHFIKASSSRFSQFHMILHKEFVSGQAKLLLAKSGQELAFCSDSIILINSPSLGLAWPLINSLSASWHAKDPQTSFRRKRACKKCNICYKSALNACKTLKKQLSVERV